MCTVTYIPCNDVRLFTSNRDEKKQRPVAVPPDEYLFPGGRILYPKDSEAGGTWMAMHENGTVVVLLNGAFFKHDPQPPYRHSRGLVVLKLVQEKDPVAAFKSIPLSLIEPFTIVTGYGDTLFECRWDGELRYLKELDNRRPHIWSSVTLYDETVVAKRRSWFAEWTQQHPVMTQEDVMRFHEFTGDGDPHNDLRMNRNHELLTVSITSFAVQDQVARVQYKDLLNDRLYRQDWQLQKTTAFQ